jgi:hypothetical protein
MPRHRTDVARAEKVDELVRVAERALREGITITGVLRDSPLGVGSGPPQTRWSPDGHSSRAALLVRFVLEEQTNEHVSKERVGAELGVGRRGRGSLRVRERSRRSDRGDQ